MNTLKSIMVMAASGMDAQSKRLQHVTENIANADTPGYRKKTISFEQALDTRGQLLEVRPGQVRLDQTPLPEIHDPAHPMADENGMYLGSNVNIVVEMADARQANRSYEANLKMFDQARQMSRDLLELLKR